MVARVTNPIQVTELVQARGLPELELRLHRVPFGIAYIVSVGQSVHAQKDTAVLRQFVNAALAGILAQGTLSYRMRNSLPTDDIIDANRVGLLGT